MNYRVPFNKPFLTGKELSYIEEAVNSGKISGNGLFTKKCHAHFEEKYGFSKCLLTTSCTDALEMAAILIGIEPGDEIILPSYTFVSTANAFRLRGAKLRFVDSREDFPGIDEEAIEPLINRRTKAIVVVHYAGIATDMKKIMNLAEKYGLWVVEDAAQAIDSFYIKDNGDKKPLGGIGHLGAFSFHETKNIISGEGGMLTINDERLRDRAEIIWEKGTNRSAFFRGEVDKYGWVDIGSSFLPSEVIAAFLYAQLEQLPIIQARRIEIWETYYEGLKSWAHEKEVQLPPSYSYSTNNAHMFYMVFPNQESRSEIISHLKEKGILSVFHYLSLHDSPYFKMHHDGRLLKNTDKFSDCLLRLPLFYGLTPQENAEIISLVKECL